MASFSDSQPLVNASPHLQPQRWIVAIALFLFTASAIGLSVYGWKQSLLFLIGGLLGVTLYHARFGFASAYRKLLADRNVQGIQAQLIMLAIATLLFAPVLAIGTVGEQSVRGAIAPVEFAGAIGAFLFGIGMQLGGACGCGTLYSIGGGSLTLILTLITFCLGAFSASLTRQFWAGLPSTEPIVVGQLLGWPIAVLVQGVVLAGLALLLHRWSQRSQKSAHPTIASRASGLPKPEPSQPVLTLLLRGPWSLVTGAIALAVLNWFTLMLSGQPWRITWGFVLWAAQLARQLGWDATVSPFWSRESAQQALNQSILADVSSVMNLGIILGAILAAALAGRLTLNRKFTGYRITSALLGGLIMGYGAFLAAGCNVSAFFGGIASTSLHGWVWIACAIAGTLIGLRLRPIFRLD